MNMKPSSLEERLIQFAVDVIHLTQKKNPTFASEHLTKQLIRSSTSAALNYGEARSGESPNDFLHKMKIVLKELRESLINLKIQQRAALIENEEDMRRLINENDELVSIFVASIKTASSKKQ
jgi:four helix bundle protein